MDNKLGIQDLAVLFAERYGMDAKSSAVFVKTVFEIVEEYIVKDKLVKIKGFGTFKLINVSDRESINVNTGERIVIAGHSKLTFTPDSALKDSVNRPFSDFETTPLNDSTSIEEMERVPSQEDNVDASTSSTDIIIPVEADVEKTNMLEVPGVIEEANEESEAKTIEPVTEDNSMEPLAEGNEISIDDSVKDVAQETESEPIIPIATSVESDNTAVSHHHTTPNKENSSYPMSSEPVNERMESTNSSSHKWLYMLITLLLMVVSYICGHYQIINKLDFSISDDTESTVPPLVEIQNEPIEAIPVIEDSVSQDTIVSDTLPVTSEPKAIASELPEEDPAEIAKYFPQVPNGEYWIVGDAGRVHHMQVGETLYRIAGKELGSQDLVRYIIVFNDFDDPNVIHTGDPIRIPKLVKKTQEQ